MITLWIQRVWWFLREIHRLWRMKNRLGLDGHWPTVMFRMYRVGDIIHDNLTGQEHKVVGVEFAQGRTNPGDKYNPDQMSCWGIYIDSPYSDGARHPWEVSIVNSKDV